MRLHCGAELLGMFDSTKVKEFSMVLTDLVLKYSQVQLASYVCE